MSVEGQTPPNPEAPKAPEGTPSVPDKPAIVEPVIPEKYEFKLPEGQSIDNAFVDAMTPAFKSLKLSQEQVNSLVEPFTKYGAEFEKLQERNFQDFMADTAKQNIAAVQKMWGTEYEANLQTAQRGIARFLPDAAKKKLEDSGLANDPEFLTAFLSIGKMIQEDRPPVSGVPNSRKPTMAVLYPTTTQ